MTKPSKIPQDVSHCHRFGRAFVILAAVAFAAGLALHARETTSPRVAAQAEPTATPFELVFNTPTAEAEPSDEPEPAGDAGDEVSFAADAWVGGYFRGDAEFYGRPWTSVYGAQSEYPRATLVLTLTDDPSEPVALIFDGLDDEDPAVNPISLEVNGQRVFEGEAWFAEWDGVGNGADAPWTTVRITIPPDLLVKGANRITLRNLTESANFGSPPYVLLSEGRAMSPEVGLFGAPSEAVGVTVVVED